MSEHESVDTFAHLTQRVFEQIEVSMRGECNESLTSGIDAFEQLGVTLNPGSLFVIAGRPMSGKSSLSMQLAANVSLAQTPCSVFSLEIDKEEYALRLMCQHAQVDVNNIKRGRMTESNWAKLIKAAGNLQDAPLSILDNYWSISDIVDNATKCVDEHGSRVIIIDNMHLVRSPNHQNKYEEVSDITRSLKQLARQTSATVIVTAQLNRKLEDREDKTPTLPDLRDSGHLEQDADLIVMLHRKELYEQSWENRGLVDVMIVKDRQGPTRTTESKFNPIFQQFS